VRVERGGARKRRMDQMEHEKRHFLVAAVRPWTR